MWAAGIFAALSQLTYPSVSAFVSIHSAGDRQGTVQGMVTGIRGLCQVRRAAHSDSSTTQHTLNLQGLGPALFGAIFYLFNVDLNVDGEGTGHIGIGAPFPPPQAAARRPPVTAPMGTVIAGGNISAPTSGEPLLVGISSVSVQSNDTCGCTSRITCSA